MRGCGADCPFNTPQSSSYVTIAVLPQLQCGVPNDKWERSCAFLPHQWCSLMLRQHKYNNIPLLVLNCRPKQPAGHFCPFQCYAEWLLAITVVLLLGNVDPLNLQQAMFARQHTSQESLSQATSPSSQDPSSNGPAGMACAQSIIA